VQILLMIIFGIEEPIKGTNLGGDSAKAGVSKCRTIGSGGLFDTISIPVLSVKNS
jgi:hypothetical protein